VEPNIHWLAPPSWSQWSVQYPLAGTTKLVAMEFQIFTGWHHYLGRSENKKMEHISSFVVGGHDKMQLRNSVPL
jgi:hypothetical protein